MAHQSQIDFMLSVKEKFPEKFKNCRVLDIGSLDLNGNNRYLFTNYKYVGVDIGYGENVDVVCSGHKFVDNYGFDVVISTECLEHDKYWKDTFLNMINLTRPNGLVLMSCATIGRPEHGTINTSPSDSPFTNDYYKNLEVSDILNLINLDSYFEKFLITTESDPSCDLYFWGLKK